MHFTGNVANYHVHRHITCTYASCEECQTYLSKIDIIIYVHSFFRAWVCGITTAY